MRAFLISGSQVIVDHINQHRRYSSTARCFMGVENQSVPIEDMGRLYV